MQISPNELKPHPKNRKIYGETSKSDLAESIERQGILVPLIVTKDHRIISGHRRWEVAIDLSLELVPIAYFESEDELDILETLLDSNCQREKTNEQKLNEYKAYKEIEEERAKNRQKLAAMMTNQKLSSGRITLPQNSAEALEEKGEARDLAAEKVGLSHFSTERGEKVLDTAEALKRSPDERDQEKGQNLLDILNKKSINRAYEQAQQILKSRPEIKEQVGPTPASKRTSGSVRSAKSREATPIIKECLVESGDIWQIGKHFVYCGDSTNWKPSLPVKPALAFADPPYGVGVDSWDSVFYWRHDWLIDFANVVAVTPGIKNLATFLRLTEMPYQWTIVNYMRNAIGANKVGYGWYNLALLFSKESVYRRCPDLHLQTQGESEDAIDSILQRSESDVTYHKGRKPQVWIEWILTKFTQDGDYVIDPFLGSGTTLFAAEETGRICYGMEIKPEYCQEIIDRYERLTNIQPKKVDKTILIN